MTHIPIDQIYMGQFKAMRGWLWEYRPDLPGTYRNGLWHAVTFL